MLRQTIHLQLTFKWILRSTPCHSFIPSFFVHAYIHSFIHRWEIIKYFRMLKNKKPTASNIYSIYHCEKISFLFATKSYTRMNKSCKQNLIMAVFKWLEATVKEFIFMWWVFFVWFGKCAIDELRKFNRTPVKPPFPPMISPKLNSSCANKI